jgi:hypothetical protein
MYRPVLLASAATMALVGATVVGTAIAEESLPAAEVDAISTTDRDGLLLAAMKDVPEFGGAYVGSDGAFHVWLTRPAEARAAHARAALASGLRVAAHGATTVTHRADYTFAQLKAWHDRLGELLAMPGVTMTDIDDRINRLTVGVEDPTEAGERVKAGLARLGIPQAAVTLVAATAVKPTLRDRTRPLRAGTAIESSAIECTLGLPVTHAATGSFGFVTNSHCSAVQGELDNGLFWQASRAAGRDDLVGAELVDPAYTTGGICPAGRRCRLTDTNFVRTNSGVNIAVGRIARPPLNSTNWNGTSTFRITDVEFTLVGNTVQKVGRSTGRTQGTVTRINTNRAVRNTDLVHLGQDVADYTATGGDSGSPVFEVTNSPATNDVTVVGIHWGSGTVDGVTESVFSPSRFIIPELGSVEMCDPAFC